MKKRMRCRKCKYLNWDFITDQKERTDDNFCGLHGRAKVNVDGYQVDLDHKGSCGFAPQATYTQLELFN